MEMKDSFCGKVIIQAARQRCGRDRGVVVLPFGFFLSLL